MTKAEQLIDNYLGEATSRSILRPTSGKGKAIVMLATDYEGAYAGFHARFNSYEFRFPGPTSSGDFVRHANRIGFNASAPIRSRTSRADWVVYVLKEW